MNYEQKYKEALEKARRLRAYPTNKPFISDLQDLFPELKESEGGEIRNWLIGYFQQYKSDGVVKFANGLKIDSIIAWLEKQGEQKSTWSEEDELMLKDAIEFIETGWSDRGKSHLVYWLKSIKNRIIWSSSEKQLDNANKVEPKFKVGDFMIQDKEYHSLVNIIFISGLSKMQKTVMCL